MRNAPLFSRIDLEFFRLFLLERFTISGLDEGEFLFLFLDLCRLSSFFVEEVSSFSDILFAGSSFSYLQHYYFLPCLIIGANYGEKNICIMLICLQRLSIFQTF